MKIPLGRALRWIFLSVLTISGIPFALFGIYRSFWNGRADDPKYQIVALVQTGPQKEALKTSFLAELLGLSSDHPLNLYRFNLEKGKNLLLSFPLIKEAELKRIPPATLFVDYTIRKPVAFVADLSNTALDEEGTLIPFYPFFSPKRLPEIALGWKKEEIGWGEKSKDERFSIAFNVLFALESYIKESPLRLIRIDASKARASSLGDQKIIVVLEERKEREMLKRTLILNPDSFEDGWNRFMVFRNSEEGRKWGSDFAFDLRLPNLGYLY